MRVTASRSMRQLSAIILFLSLSGLAAGPAVAGSPMPSVITLGGHVLPILAQHPFSDPAAVPSEIAITVALPLRHAGSLSHQIPYLTPADVLRDDAPTTATVRRVVAYLRASGLQVDDVAGNRLLVEAHGSRQSVEAAFHVHLRGYQVRGRGFFANDDEPRVPAALAGYILAVQGLNDYTVLHGHYAAARPQNGPPYAPADIQVAYNTATAYGAGNVTGAGVTIGIVSYGGVSPRDLAGFARNFNVPTHTVTTEAVGGTTRGDPLESTLDTEWSGALAPGAAIKLYLAGASTARAFTAAYNRVVAEDATPVVSTSFGACEAQYTAADLKVDSQIFSVAAAEGISVMAASGDGGSDDCGNGTTGVDYPGSDPNVTDVGGTTLNLDAGDHISSETGWSYGGGGISQVFAQPAWQTGQGVPQTGKRAVPDLAFNADTLTPYEYYVLNSFAYGGGTSFGAPVLAGMVALAEQLAGGAAPVGPLNPALYAFASHPPAQPPFHDITVGSNGAYSCGAGWDAVTGWGSADAWNLARDLAAWATAQTVSVAVDPAAGIPGAAITVRAVHGADGQTYDVYFDKASGTPLGSLGAGTNWALATHVPAPAKPGAHHILLAPQGGGASVSTPFTVLKKHAPAALPLATTMQMYPTFGWLGAAPVITVVNPAPGVSAYDVYWNGPVTGTVIASITAAMGWHLLVHVPIDVPGPHTMSIMPHGGSGAISATFTLVPTLAASPGNIAEGQAVVVSGQEYLPNARVSLLLDGTGPVLGMATSTSTGLFGPIFITITAPPGTHTIIARGGGPDGTAIIKMLGAPRGKQPPATYRPTFNLSTVYSQVGTPHVVTVDSGTGFLPNAQVTIALNGATQKTIKADPLGNVATTAPVSFTVPGNTAGKYTISVTGSTTTTASLIYVIQQFAPVVYVTPAVSASGHVVMVQGRGFANGEYFMLGLEEGNNVIPLGMATGWKNPAFDYFKFLVPNIPSNQTYVVQAYGVGTLAYGKTPLTLGTAASLALNPQIARTGARITATATNFGASETVTFTYYQPFTRKTTTLGTAQSNSAGVASLSANLPFAPTPQWALISAQGAWSLVLASNHFTTTPPSLTATPTVVKPGDTLHVSGVNYGPNEQVNFTFNRQGNVGHITTDGNGSFSNFSFVVGNLTAGNFYQVIGIGALSLEKAAVTVTVTAPPRWARHAV